VWPVHTNVMCVVPSCGLYLVYCRAPAFTRRGADVKLWWVSVWLCHSFPIHYILPLLLASSSYGAGGCAATHPPHIPPACPPPHGRGCPGHCPRSGTGGGESGLALLATREEGRALVGGLEKAVEGLLASQQADAVALAASRRECIDLRAAVACARAEVGSLACANGDLAHRMSVLEGPWMEDMPGQHCHLRGVVESLQHTGAALAVQLKRAEAGALDRSALAAAAGAYLRNAAATGSGLGVAATTTVGARSQAVAQLLLAKLQDSSSVSVLSASAMSASPGGSTPARGGVSSAAMGRGSSPSPPHSPQCRQAVRWASRVPRQHRRQRCRQ
jgi:hypothetical protein